MVASLYYQSAAKSKDGASKSGVQKEEDAAGQERASGGVVHRSVSGMRSAGGVARDRTGGLAGMGQVADLEAAGLLESKPAAE